MKKLLIFLLIFVWFGFAEAAIYYVDKNADPGGDGTTQELTGAHCAWDTIADVNGATFAAGDSILFNKGCTWREQLTVPSSGSAGLPITFGAYGSGANPIINGADLITPGTSWSATGAWSTGFLYTITNYYAADQVYNIRDIIPANTSSYSGTKIRITLAPHDTETVTISGCSIGIAHVSGDQNFDSAPTRITFDGGSSTTTVSVGTPKVSDEMTFTFDKTKRYLIHIYWNPRRTEPFLNLAYTANYGDYSSGADKTLSTTMTADQSGVVFANVSKLEISSGTANVWQATVTTEPKHVFFNGVHGQLKASAAACTSARDWYWASNVLYVYSTSDPDKAYTSPGIESGARDYGIYAAAARNYITVDGLHVIGTNGAGIHTGTYPTNSGSNWVIINNTVEYCSWSSGLGTAGIYITGANGYVAHNTVNYINMYGISVVGDPSGTIVELNTVSNCVNEVPDWGAGIYESANGGIVRKNYLSENFIGIVVRQGNGNCSYNLILNSTAHGIDSNEDWSATGKVLIANNTVIHNPTEAYGFGIAIVSPGDGVQWENNIVYITGGDNTCAGYFISGTSLVNVATDYNLVYKSAGSAYLYRVASTYYDTLANWKTALSGSGYGGEEVHAINADPVFVNPASDFHLQSTSPAINAGVDVGLTEDYEGKGMRGLPDIGAYEYQNLGGQHKQMMDSFGLF
jgi:hypothetical protein